MDFNLGEITLAALVLAVTLSCFTRLNIGVLAIGAAWLIGVYVGGMPARDISAGFPVDLFLTLTGVSLLFSLAQVNGTLEKVAHEAVRFCRGRVGFVPILYFFLGAVLASAGPGNIATTGLLAPIAMSAALRMNISPFLMAIMVGNGANSGSLSPLAPTGIIVGGLMTRIQLPGMELRTWFYNFIAHAIVAFGGYLLFGGWKLLRRTDRLDVAIETAKPMERPQVITLGVILLLLVGVIAAGLHIGFAAFTGAVLLILLGAADQDEAIKKIPWGSILMVCGMTVLISLLEKTSGMQIFTNLLTSVATRTTIIPFLAMIIGLISAYSSTSGVVLPAFLPLVPGLTANLGGGIAASIASTMNVAGHLVDVSPLSTIGALCLASVPAGKASRRLFNQLLAWGLSMTVAGAVICWFLFA